MTKLKGPTFGSCNFASMAPPREHLSAETITVNFTLSFEDALKLAIAVDECVHKLNRYNRSTREGKRSAMYLTLHLKKKRVAILEAKLKKKK